MKTLNKNTNTNSQPENTRHRQTTKKVLVAIATVAIFCVTVVAIQAGEMSPGGDQTTTSSFAWNWTAIAWMLWMPALALVFFSLIVSKRKGWGWVVTGSAIIGVLIVLQFAWSIVTSFRGDPADDEDYFKPLDNWTSDSF